MAEWISVNDQLPITNQNILIFDGGLRVARFSDYWDQNQDSFIKQLEQRKITHWIPLPSPPSQ